jgi:hypothetical protein
VYEPWQINQVAVEEEKVEPLILCVVIDPTAILKEEEIDDAAAAPAITCQRYKDLDLLSVFSR